MTRLRVIIAGAGLGGLCLAQALRKAQIEVDIFERDQSPWERPQGYRLHLEADALNALREVLTPELHRLFEATAMRTEPFTTIFSTSLKSLERILTDDGQDQEHWPEYVTPQKLHCNVDRATLREITLIGLEDVCHFGKRLTRYESKLGGVVAWFDDGTTTYGDVLVGADGIRSAVREQRAPYLQTMDAGVQAIYGRVPYEAAGKLVPREILTDIFSIASDERKVFLGLGAVKFPMQPQDAAHRIMPTVSLKNQDNYLVCIVGGRHEYFPQNNKALQGATSKDLQRLAIDMLKDWPTGAASIVEAGDPESFFIVGMYTSIPAELDVPTNVTMIGDAVHAMTPTLGRGANLAMRDGALLSRHLRAVAEGQTSIRDALAAHEAAMVKYGFAVVRESVQIGKARMGQNSLPVQATGA